MNKTNFNKNPEMSKEDRESFQDKMERWGYELEFTTGYRIWPAGKKEHWSEHLSHLWLSAEKGSDTNHIIFTWVQAVVRLRTIYTKELNNNYNHINLMGPRENGSHLRDSIDYEILKPVCDGYINDTSHADTEKEVYRAMINDSAGYLQEWRDLLEVVEAMLNEILWDDWSLRAKK